MKKIFLFVFVFFGFFSVSRGEATGEIITFPANPAKGFQWGYALYLPTTMDTSRKLPLLLQMNNSGYTKSVEEAEQKALRELRNNGYYYRTSDELGVPLLLPLVQRFAPVDSEQPFYTHELNRATFISQDEKIKRLDLQVLAMLKDARKQLKKRGIRTQKKYLVTGFSASGAFAWRWTMLHPEYVLATVSGGDHYPMLPLEEMDGMTLIYPVGVGDFKQYTGKKFNKKAWLKVPIFSSNGEVDYNDPLPYEECWAEKIERPVLQHVLPEKDTIDRMRHSRQLLAQLAPNVQTHLYPNLEHETKLEDVSAFLKKNMNGGPLQPITPTDTSDIPASIPVKIKTLYFGKKAPIKKGREHLGNTDLILETVFSVPRWLQNEKYCALKIMHGKEKVVDTQPGCGNGWFGVPTYMQFGLSEENMAKLKAYKDRTFSVRAHNPEFLDIPTDLTFSIP